MEYIKLKHIATYPTGKLNSNAAIEDGQYPFYTCSHDIYRINQYSYDGEYVLLGGNNATGDFPIFYYNGKFDAYQRTYIIQPKDRNKYCTRFLFYAIGLQLMQMQSNAAGTATKFLTQPILDNLNIQNIIYSEQNKIASILSAYDDLIEKNNRKIAILQEQAQELYKEWFVRFRFPGHETAKFVDGLPEGWTVKPLGNYASIVMGQSPDSMFYNSEEKGLPFHQGVGSYGELYLKDDVYSTEGKRMAEPSSIVFSVRAPVGRLNITKNKIILGRGVAGVNAKDGHNGFLFWLLKTTYAKEDMIGNGSIFASVTKDELFKQKIVVPNDSVLVRFDMVSANIERQLWMLYLQNRNLTQQRDLLLPRLMSGKLEVK